MVDKELQRYIDRKINIAVRKNMLRSEEKIKSSITEDLLEFTIKGYKQIEDLNSQAIPKTKKEKVQAFIKEKLTKRAFGLFLLRIAAVTGLIALFPDLADWIHLLFF